MNPREKDDVVLPGGWLRLLLSAVAGVQCLSPALKAGGAGLRSFFAFLIGIFLLLAAVWSPLDWAWTAGGFSLANLLLAVLLGGPAPKGTLGHRIRTLLTWERQLKALRRSAGSWLAALGMILPLALLHVSISQLLFGDLMFVLPDMEALRNQLFQTVLLFFSVVGWISFRRRRELARGGKRALKILGGGLVLALLLLQIYNLMVGWPRAQALEAELYGSEEQFVHGLILFFTWLLVLDLLPKLYRFSREKKRSRRSSGTVLVFTLISCLPGFVVTSGSLPLYSFVLGKWMEDRSELQSAIGLYNYTLLRAGTPKTRAYLLHHTGMLLRGTGRLDDAAEIFRRVLVNHAVDEKITRRSYLALDRLAGRKDDSSEKRVVIPGIENSTALRAAYCVPNSMALLLNFFGSTVGAREIGRAITELGKGTFLPDEIFFAEKLGYRHLLIPGSNMATLRKLVEKGLPVLVFFRGHVFAVFGYDDLMQTVVSYDVNTYDMWEEMPVEELQDQWNGGDRVLGVVYPDSLSKLVDEVLGPETRALGESYLAYLLSRMKGVSYMDRRVFLERATAFVPACWQARIARGKASPLCAEGVEDYFFAPGANPDFFSDRFRYLLLVGDTLAARDFLMKAQLEKPLNFNYARLLAEILRAEGRGNEAREVLYSSMDPSGGLDPQALFLLASLEEDAGLPKAAAARQEKIFLNEEAGGALRRLSFARWHKLMKNRERGDRVQLLEQYLESMGCGDMLAVVELLKEAESFRYPSLREQRRFKIRLRRLESCLAVEKEAGYLIGPRL